MTGKQFTDIIVRLFGERSTAKSASEALGISKRSVERLRNLKKVPPVIALATERMAEKVA